MRLMAAAMAILGAGCSTTTVGRVGDPSAQWWLAEHAGSEMVVATAGRSDQDGVALQAIAPTEIQFRTREGAVVPIGNVARLTVVKHGRGALDGALVGVGLGVFLGTVYGLTRDLSNYERSMDCTIICNNSDAAEWAALEFGVLYLLVGTLTGAIIGHRDILDLR